MHVKVVCRTCLREIQGLEFQVLEVCFTATTLSIKSLQCCCQALGYTVDSQRPPFTCGPSLIANRNTHERFAHSCALKVISIPSDASNLGFQILALPKLPA